MSQKNAFFWQERGQCDLDSDYLDELVLCNEERCPSTNRHLQFEKNYPKNLFIPLIYHLSEIGLQTNYEECVGTRSSFEGKNVVSLREIHKVMSQPWFKYHINSTILLSNMANKILMNSKIKKKLFHLLLIKYLFSIPLQDPKYFKKIVSKKANEICLFSLPEDDLFEFPSAVIYLLHLFASLINPDNQDEFFTGGRLHKIYDEEERKNTCDSDFLVSSQIGLQYNSKYKHHKNHSNYSSKYYYKYYISQIIYVFNLSTQDDSILFDTLSIARDAVLHRQNEIKEKYGLPDHVPAWSSVIPCVIDRCWYFRRRKLKLTYSLVSQWLLEFKMLSTTTKGFPYIAHMSRQAYFAPIILVQPVLYF